MDTFTEEFAAQGKRIFTLSLENVKRLATLGVIAFAIAKALK